MLISLLADWSEVSVAILENETRWRRGEKRQKASGKDKSQCDVEIVVVTGDVGEAGLLNGGYKADDRIKMDGGVGCGDIEASRRCV